MYVKHQEKKQKEQKKHQKETQQEAYVAFFSSLMLQSISHVGSCNAKKAYVYQAKEKLGIATVHAVEIF